MKSYYLSLTTETKTNIDNLKLIVDKGLSLGLKYDDWSKGISTQEAINILFKREEQGTIRGRLDSNPFIISNIGFLSIRSNDHYCYWKKQFEYHIIPIILELRDFYSI